MDHSISNDHWWVKNCKKAKIGMVQWFLLFKEATGQLLRKILESLGDNAVIISVSFSMIFKADFTQLLRFANRKIGLNIAIKQVNWAVKSFCNPRHMHDWIHALQEPDFFPFFVSPAYQPDWPMLQICQSINTIEYSRDVLRWL